VQHVGYLAYPDPDAPMDDLVTVLIDRLAARCYVSYPQPIYACVNDPIYRRRLGILLPGCPCHETSDLAPHNPEQPLGLLIGLLFTYHLLQPTNLI
jgi:hypothetical protein